MKDSQWDSPIQGCASFIASHKKKDITGEKAFLEGLDEISFEISPDHIFEIPECREFRKIGFVDGGTLPIIRSADFTINLNRVAGVICNQNTISSPKYCPVVIEFYSATIINEEPDGQLYYVTELFPREEIASFYLPSHPFKLSLKEARERRGRTPNIEAFGNIAMRFAEWTYATQFIERELEEKDIFVRDGSLQTGFEDEIIILDRLIKVALRKNVYLTGLSKTCRLLTTQGNSLVCEVDMIGRTKYPKKRWYYHPVKRFTRADNQAEVYFIKLHQEASRPFRYDINIDQSNAMSDTERKTVLSNLAANSNDLSFIGYPYGLIKADLLSHVSFSELESQKIQVISEFSREVYTKYILPRIRSVDAHDILNTLRKS
jgi:hypothetical protein